MQMTERKSNYVAYNHLLIVFVGSSRKLIKSALYFERAKWVTCCLREWRMKLIYVINCTNIQLLPHRRHSASINLLKPTGHVMHQQFNLLKPTGHVMHQQFNLLKPTGHVMHQQFNIQQLYVLPTLCLCVLYLAENKQRLVPLTA